MLREADERRDAEWILAALNAADGLGVDADQFGETLLRQVRPQTGVGHVAANDAQEFLIGHYLDELSDLHRQSQEFGKVKVERRSKFEQSHERGGCSLVFEMANA